MEGTEKRKSYSLCPECTACPSVTLLEDGRVAVGEAPNVATLDAEEWNVLVRLVREGVLSEVLG